jgi:glycosyltransferase involved in cell wall biosynthesis
MYVSIVVPTYNRKDSLKKTLTSLLNQDYPHNKYEIIVCDDGSIDETELVVKDVEKNSDINIKYYRQKNSGPAAARNLGLKKANGEIIGFIDDDCVAVKKWLSSAIENFNNPNVGGTQGPTIQDGSIPFRKKLFHYARTSTVLEKNFFYATCNIFYRKDILNTLNGFDENFPRPCWGEDTDLGNRVSLEGYEITFDERIKVYHDIQYIPFLKYLKSLKKYSSRALLVKRYPFMRKRLTLRFIGIRSHIYPIFIFVSILCALGILIGMSEWYFTIFTILSIIFYL